MRKLINTLTFSVFLALLFVTKPSTTGKKLAEFDPYVAEFSKNLKRFGHNNKIHDLRSLEIEFADDLDPNEIGRCYTLLHRVEFSKKYWDNAKIHERDELFQHEVGHCVLKLDHQPPLSIMQASGILGDYYKYNYKRLTNELFGCYTGDCVDLYWDEERYK